MISVLGNVLWAVYQFIVFIVLLSVLRARMVNTYHRIFRWLLLQWDPEKSEIGRRLWESSFDFKQVDFTEFKWLYQLLKKLFSLQRHYMHLNVVVLFHSFLVLTVPLFIAVTTDLKVVIELRIYLFVTFSRQPTVTCIILETITTKFS